MNLEQREDTGKTQLSIIVGCRLDILDKLNYSYLIIS